MKIFEITLTCLILSVFILNQGYAFFVGFGGADGVKQVIEEGQEKGKIPKPEEEVNNSFEVQFVLKWGSEGSGDGQFNNPSDIMVDNSENVYVVDTGNNRIQKFNSNGTFITKWGSAGSGNGQFNNPHGIAIDNGGNVYVVDTGNNRIQEFNHLGDYHRKWGSVGAGDVQFSGPHGIAVDIEKSEYLYVVDRSNNRIQKFTCDGTFVKKWGSDYGVGRFLFIKLDGIAVDNSGNIYVTDEEGSDVKKFDSNGTFVTKWGEGNIISNSGCGDGQFWYPSGINIDNSGNVYVVDTSNDRIQKFTSDGKFIGKWGKHGSEDGQFIFPHGIALDKSGNIYVVDKGNNRIQKFHVQ